MKANMFKLNFNTKILKFLTGIIFLSAGHLIGIEGTECQGDTLGVNGSIVLNQDQMRVPRPRVVALYHVTRVTGGPVELRLAEWDGKSTTTAVVDGRGSSLLSDFKTGPYSKRIYTFYVNNRPSPLGPTVHLDVRSDIKTPLPVAQPPGLPKGVNVKAAAVAIEVVNGNEEVHAVVLGEDATTGKKEVYYYQSSNQISAWTQKKPHTISDDKKFFGRNVELELLPSSSFALISYPEIDKSRRQKFYDVADILVWQFDTALASFPSSPLYRTPLDKQVWSGETVNPTTVSPKASPHDFLIDLTGGKVLFAAAPARVEHRFLDPGTDIYSLSQTGFSHVRKLQPPSLKGPWGAGALTTELSPIGSTLVKLVTIEEGVSPAHDQILKGGKVLRIYTSPDDPQPPASQQIDAISTINGLPPFFTFPVATNHQLTNTTYAGTIYVNSGAGNHEVRIYNFDGQKWVPTVLDSVPPATYNLENLVITSR